MSGHKLKVLHPAALLQEVAVVPTDKSKYSLLKWNYQYKTIHVKRIIASEIPSSTFKEWISE